MTYFMMLFTGWATKHLFLVMACTIIAGWLTRLSVRRFLGTMSDEDYYLNDGTAYFFLWLATAMVLGITTLAFGLTFLTLLFTK